MAVTLDTSKLDPIIEKYRDVPGNLIPVLHEIQNAVGYLPPEVQSYVSRQLKVPLSTVHGVVTFYSFFSSTPRGEHTIGVCMGTACYVRGAEEILDKLKEDLEVDLGETSSDGKFTLTITRCLGTCSLAPVVMVDDRIYGKLSPGELSRVLANY
ncbi:MAG: NAD(P)H-dependent oxidoreductase subunit E [Bacillota bacterium]